jgi:putative DNA methylase
VIPKECKRLAEVDFPVAEVSKHSAREKSIRHGHPSTLHLWWARRPLAACRAMLMALLLPDPCDEHYPEEFKTEARVLLKHMPGGSATAADLDLRKALLKFIADFANWDNSANPTYLQCARGLVRAAHGEEPPLVVDSFAGGGSIPLESLRVGCDTFASDLNPVACLVLRTMLESIPRYGSELAQRFRAESAQLEQGAEREIARYYPKEPNGQYPFAYVWARTARCEAPNCGLEIPLLTSLWLSKRRNAKVALRYTVRESAPGSYKLEFELFQPTTELEVGPGTVRHVRAVCPRCGVTLPNARIRAQLCTHRGGASDARLIAVVVRDPDGHLSYRLPNERDYSAYIEAAGTLRRQSADATAAIPNEPLPQRFRAKSSFDVIPYGASTWADLFNARQLLSLTTITRLIRSNRSRTDCETAVSELLALSVSKLAERLSAGVSWITQTQAIRGTFSRQAVPMIWDYVEIVPFGVSTQYREVAEAMARAIETEAAAGLRPAMVREANAAETLLPDQSAATWFTDPPYYDNIAYADLADFFYVWLKRALPDHPLLRDPYDPSNRLTPKAKECIQSEERIVDGRPMDRDHFERCVREAFHEGNRICSPNGIASVVFAHKKTEGWEALLAALHSGNWTITASWPIITERAARLVARQQAALAASVHLVCRPRAVDAGVGDWRGILRELPGRVRDWMERLSGEGIRGADLVFSCIGPALELFSKYERVLDAEDHEIPLGGDPAAIEPYKRGFLSYVWEVAGRTALQQVLGTAEARARNGSAGALEEDARLTALFLWTLQSTDGAVSDQQSSVSKQDEESGESEDEEEETTKPKKGFTLVYDVVRRFAQPLGIHLPNWEGRIIDIKKGVVRLIPVTERADQLFGEVGTETVARAIERSGGQDTQYTLFPDQERVPDPALKARKPGKGRRSQTLAAASAPRDATTLDRVHAAMLLQAGGQATALRAVLEAETQRSRDFLRLANALSALYPRESEEKRLLDAMLLAVPR